jgi:hypothetical protein
MVWCFIKNRDMVTFVSSLCNGIITRLCQLAYIIVVVIIIIIIIIYLVTLFCHVIGFGEFRFVIQCLAVIIRYLFVIPILFSSLSLKHLIIQRYVKICP